MHDSAKDWGKVAYLAAQEARVTITPSFVCSPWDAVPEDDKKVWREMARLLLNEVVQYVGAQVPSGG